MCATFTQSAYENRFGPPQPQGGGNRTSTEDQAVRLVSAGAAAPSSIPAASQEDVRGIGAGGDEIRQEKEMLRGLKRALQKMRQAVYADSVASRQDTDTLKKTVEKMYQLLADRGEQTECTGEGNCEQDNIIAL